MISDRSQMYRDSDRSHPPHSKYTTLNEPCLLWNQGHKSPTQYRGYHRPLYLTRQCILIYLSLFYTEILVVLIPPQNMFKMFPQISGLENIAFVKGWWWYTAITIEAILFNLDHLWQSLIHHTNPLVNLWQI